MSQLTIRDALLELRRLNGVVVNNAEEDLKRAQERADAAKEMTETLDRITTQLGFSVALETVATTHRVPVFKEETTPAKRNKSESAPKRGKRGPYNILPDEEQAERDAKIVELRKRGLSHRKIAKKLKIGHSVVWRTLSKLPEDPVDAVEPVVKKSGPTETVDADPRFRFKLSEPLGENEENFFKLLRKNYPNFTKPENFVEKGWVANDKVASPTITRLRKKGVPIESAKQARGRGEDVADNESGWRFIIDE